MMRHGHSATDAYAKRGAEVGMMFVLVMAGIRDIKGC
jgi:hypothetical protein